jgi:hypothetical protein
MAVRLANLERRLYREMPPPDVIVRLAAPLDVTSQRNNGQWKVEDKSEGHIQSRTSKSLPPSFPNARTLDLDPNLPAPARILALRRLLWDA